MFRQKINFQGFVAFRVQFKEERTQFSQNKTTPTATSLWTLFTNVLSVWHLIMIRIYSAAKQKKKREMKKGQSLDNEIPLRLPLFLFLQTESKPLKKKKESWLTLRQTLLIRSPSRAEQDKDKTTHTNKSLYKKSVQKELKDVGTPRAALVVRLMGL